MDKKERKNFVRLKEISQQVSEQSRIALDKTLEQFEASYRLQEYTFPDTLTSHERAYIHQKAGERGWSSKSDGQGENRKVTVKKAFENGKKVVKPLEVGPEAITSVWSLKSLEAKLEEERKAILFPPIERWGGDNNEGKGDNNNKEHNNPASASAKLSSDLEKESTRRFGYTNRLFTQPPSRIPRPVRPSRLGAARSRLPIAAFRERILQDINNHKVVFIKGDTGCGKTTQVPQFILEEASQQKRKVRIICTVPRRIAAVSISDRVASERGEEVGGTVGYQIRLESCVSPVNTILTYCTSGILLRSLTSSDCSILRNTTHIIIDEVHERDRQTEFLLACLKDVSQQFHNLKIILMGADMNTELLISYFGGEQQCPLIQVEGRAYPVSVFYLEDILEFLNENSNRSGQRGKFKTTNNKSGYSFNPLNRNGRENETYEASFNAPLQGVDPSIARLQEEQICAALRGEVDDKIKRVYCKGDLISVNEFVALVQNGRIPVDYQHSVDGITMLMACSARGFANSVDLLLRAFGADSRKTVWTDDGCYTAQELARNFGQEDVLRVLEQHDVTRALESQFSNVSISVEKQERLDRYQASSNDDRVDLQLVVKLLHWIHITSDPSEAVLVFLPGYDEIVNLKQMIFIDPELGNMSNDLVVFMLHSNIQTGDQRAVFERPCGRRRKIILSTNIAETSLTIEDIVFVIDSGKVKEKTFDSMTGVTQLKSNWISKASANQRQGRAGRCTEGKCFRLYSSFRYNQFNNFAVAEIIRSSLQELCLYTRSFIRSELHIADFFRRLPEAPAPIAVKNSVDALVQMGALDEKEQLTRLGLFLLDLPIEPYLGRALIYAITLKCLDPILTLVSLISYREPFQLPANPAEKNKALDAKFMFSQGSRSDHMAGLKAFQDWELSNMYPDSTHNQFCTKYYLSSSTFDMVYGIRTQLLGQIRNAGFVTSTMDLKDLNTNSNNCSLVVGILVATVYPNICCPDKEHKCFFNEYDKNIKVHPSSIVQRPPEGKGNNIPGDWIIFDEMCQQNFCKVMRNCTAVNDIHIALFGGNSAFVPVSYDGGTSAVAAGPDPLEAQFITSKQFDISGWVGFRGSDNVIGSVLYLREKLNKLIEKRLDAPCDMLTEFDKQLVQCLANILEIEYKRHGFEDVQNIGQWPKFVSGNVLSAPRTGYERSFALPANKEDSRGRPVRRWR